MLLAESQDDVSSRVDLVRRLAPPAADGMDWDSLPYVDVDAALLGLRQFLFGERMIAEIRCSNCNTWGDVEFSIAEYLKAKPPRVATERAPCRIPTVAQVVSALKLHGEAEAASRALEAEYAEHFSREESRRQNAALEKVAPPLAGFVTGTCPQCAAGVSGWFDPGAFVIAELRRRAGMLFEEIHLLASRYGWSEEAILSLPRSRRSTYAEMIAAEIGAQ